MKEFYKTQNIQLFCGDSWNILKEMEIKVDSIITDPPYNIFFENNKWDQGFNVGEYCSIFDNILKENGQMILFQGWSNVCQTINDFKNNFILKNWIIYDRIKGRGAKTNFVSTREDILWFIKNEKKYTFNNEVSKIKKKTGGSIGKRNGCQYRKLSNIWTDISPIVPWSKERVKHPTQKPIELMERLIRIFSNQGEIILDPFAGSGSTGIACMRLNRKCILIEREEKYCNIIIDRLKEEENNHNK